MVYKSKNYIFLANVLKVGLKKMKLNDWWDFRGLTAKVSLEQSQVNVATAILW